LAGAALLDDMVLRTLALINQAGSIAAVVPLKAELHATEDILSDWCVVSGWTGKALACDGEASIEEDLAEASLILLPDVAPPLEYIQALGDTDAGEFLLAALDGGAILVAEGAAAEAMGEAAGEGSSPVGGLGWIPRAVIHTHFSPDKDLTILQKRKDLFRIGLSPRTALALGPNDEREIWGDIPPTITFGRGWVA
jgi:hypothetical protein